MFKFVSGEPCHPYEPFKCPGNGACISIQYLCDGAPDCPDGYDEDARLCTAGNITALYLFDVYFEQPNFGVNIFFKHITKDWYWSLGYLFIR